MHVFNCPLLARAAFLFVLLMHAVVPALAAAVIVGDPQHPADLPGAIHEAHERGANDITVAPGTYDVPSQNHGDTIVMDRWSDTTIHADGVALIFEELDHRPLSFRHCSNVIWDGGTLRFVHPSYTQGRIKAIGQEDKGSYCEWEIDAGYPTNIDPVKLWFNTVDQSTRVLKVGAGDWTPRHADITGPGRFRLHYGVNDKPGFAVNDWLVNRAPGGSSIAHMDGCANCTLQNVTLQNGGFATIFETGGAGGNHYLKCKIQPGPRPPGATEDQLVGCGADGVHSTGTGTGPDLEDCVFSGVFLDDCIAVHGSFQRVVESEGNTIVLARGGTRLVPGDPLRIADTHGFFAQAKCMAIQELPENRVRVTLDQDLNVPIDHSQDKQEKLGTKANNPDRCGRGYRILRCRLGDTRSRGILVKADDGLIDHCTIEGCGMSGVSVGPEFWWNEANYAWNVTISNNTFRNCSKNNGDQASVWIHGDGAIGNRNITIADNQFQDCYGRYVLRVEAADGVDIRSNHFAGSFAARLEQPGNVVWLNDAKNAKLLGNVVTGQGPFAGELVRLSKSVAMSDVQNDDATGIVVQP